MYYLKKKSYEKKIVLTDKYGSVLGVDTIQTHDRCIYRARLWPNEPYRQIDDGERNHYKTVIAKFKRLATALKHRRDIFDKTGELFDIYDDNGVVDMHRLYMSSSRFVKNTIRKYYPHRNWAFLEKSHKKNASGGYDILFMCKCRTAHGKSTQLMDLLHNEKTTCKKCGFDLTEEMNLAVDVLQKEGFR